MSFRFPDQYTLEDRDAYFGTVENIVETNKVEFGISSYSIRYSKHSGEFEGKLQPKPFQPNPTGGGR